MPRVGSDARSGHLAASAIHGTDLRGCGVQNRLLRAETPMTQPPVLRGNGELITVHVENMDVRKVLEMLGRQASMNLR